MAVRQRNGRRTLGSVTRFTRSVMVLAASELCTDPSRDPSMKPSPLPRSLTPSLLPSHRTGSGFSVAEGQRAKELGGETVGPRLDSRDT